ncbi:MAG: (d)CMP kinase [Anaerovoracaceae bacterium]
MIRIAVDGPGGAGKSTIARRVAKALGIEYIDTGAMYRAIGLKLIKTDTDMNDEKALVGMLEETSIDFSNGRTILDGVDVSGQIRTEEVSAKASACSALAPVRVKLVDLQRKMAASKSVIMDGRDIGTNVIKDAEVKIFLTAAPEERARRRYDELTARGLDADYDKVLADINARDYNDTHRKLNPLTRAEDAVEIDSTDMSIDEVTAEILSIAEKH